MVASLIKREMEMFKSFPCFALRNSTAHPNWLDQGCKACGNPLQLSNCFHETVSGLGSLLYLTCANGECEEINVCRTNKTHRYGSAQRGRPIFDVNTKLAAGRLARLFNLLYVQNHFTSFTDL